MHIHKLLALPLFSAVLLVAIPARANQDAVQFGTNIHVPANSSVHDAVCFFCSVNAEGEIKGNVVVFFGDIHVAGKADHDAVNFFGSVRVEENASIGNNLVSMFGGVRLGEHASIGHDLVAMFGSVHAPESVTVGNNRVVQPIWILILPLAIFGLLIGIAVREVRAHLHRRAMLHYPFPPAP